jgi:translation initiation factor IF-3
VDDENQTFCYNFFAAINDIKASQRANKKKQQIYPYADDIMLPSMSIQDVHKSFMNLIRLVEDNSLRVHIMKTKMTIFRKGRKMQYRERINYGLECYILQLKNGANLKMLKA